MDKVESIQDNSRSSLSPETSGNPLKQVAYHNYINLFSIILPTGEEIVLMDVKDAMDHHCMPKKSCSFISYGMNV